MAETVAIGPVAVMMTFHTDRVKKTQVNDNESCLRWNHDGPEATKF